MTAELIPFSPSQREITELTEFVSEDKLSPEAQDLIEYAKKRGRIRRDNTRENIALQFENTFQLIGGVPRLALWADKNPGQFFVLYSKLIPNAVKADLTVLTKSDLENVSTDQLKRMILERLPEPE